MASQDRIALESRNGGHDEAVSQPQQSESAQNENDPSRNIFSQSKLTIRILVVAVKTLMFTVVLALLVASKISITTMLAHLRSMTIFDDAAINTTNKTVIKAQHKTAVGLYWQLLIILMVPNTITWVRALFNGVIGKSSSQPWPKFKAFIGGTVLAAVEAASETALLFYGWIVLPPEISLLLMNGMFSVQAVLNLIEVVKYGFTTYDNIDNPRPGWVPTPKPIAKATITRHYCSSLVVITFIIGLLIQFSGLTSICVFVSLNETWYETAAAAAVGTTQPLLSRPLLIGTLTIAVCTLLLSFVWSDKIQRLVTIPDQKLSTLSQQFKEYAEKHKYKPTARWTSNFLTTSVRMIVYPFASYVIFRYTYKLKSGTNANNFADHSVDPWCLNNYTVSIDEAFQWEPQEIEMFAIHIACSFLAYVFSWLACFMSLHKYGLIAPVMLATPVSLVVFMLITNLKAEVGFQMDELFLVNLSGNTTTVVLTQEGDTKYWIVAFSFAVLLWVGQITITTYRLWKTKNAILATDEDMFVRPYYNSILLEQYLILNRDATMRNYKTNRKGCKVFICSTMYRENVTEMRQMLQSLRRVAKYCKSERNSVANTGELRQITKFESHIFFDGGCKDDEILQFAVQLLSLIHDTLGVKLEQATRKQTPYGCRLEWMIEADDDNTNGMPFTVHLKDNQKVKNKKRWSQVMYMNYVINYRAEEDGLDLDNTFILTTDADINFKAESAIVLLDMLACDFHVGAVSSRTHPKGYGPLYWYQVFDYAIGHWLQKPAEHILGCVLCCPGCFSMFRCSALKDCLDEYSEEVTNAHDFLTKDMGEDRWLCTLLVENNWRLDYCAISTDETYSPVEFDEFFKQRRRWIPSTVANLWLLVSSAKKITRRNISINFLFIFYQVFLILSTVISPATVILITSSSLENINQTVAILSLLLVGVLYGLVCLFTSERTQLDLAKILTILFSVLMVVVVVELVRAIVHDIELLFYPHEQFLVPVNKFFNDHRFFNCQIVNCHDLAKYENQTNNGTTPKPQEAIREGLPVAASTMYMGFFGFVFSVAALLHFQEFFCLAQFIWYLLGLPGGYLILLIYSAANLNSRSWGTREVKSDKDKENIFTILYSSLKRTISACFQGRTKPEPSQDNESKQVDEEESDEKEPEEEQVALEPAEITHPWLYGWLQDHNCSQFYNKFVKAGYTMEWYVAEMTREDLKMIGVKPEGFVRHMDKCIKKTLFASHINSGIPESVEKWIIGLNMNEEEENYIRKFQAAGYITSDDVEHLREIKEEELMSDIGVTKIAHRRRFMQAISMLRKESNDEKRMRMAKDILKERRQVVPLEEKEHEFWTKKIETTLGPVPEGLTKAAELKDGLDNLRNVTLVAMLLVNLIWIVLFLTLTFKDLKIININPELMIIVFLAVYGVILLIQFVAMVIHRLITFSHYIARLNEELPVEQDFEQDSSPRRNETDFNV